MIPVREISEGVFEPVTWDTITSLDGEIRAPMQVILHPSWTAEERARFGVYLAENFVVPAGKRTVGAGRFERVEGVVRQVFDVEDIPPVTVFDGAEFLGRVTDDEYAAITAAARQSPQIGRWLDTFRLRGEIDVAGATAIAAKAGLVAAGLLTRDRADEIFSVR